jgi:hypothetical protein
MEALLTSNHDNDSDMTDGKTSDEITGNAWNETRQVRIHTWAPGTSPKLKSL